MSRNQEFTASAGPWYVREEQGRLVGGFRVLQKHLNPRGICHGGMLATFCDVMMPTSAAYQSNGDTGLLPTVSLSLDYLEPTPAGAWVEIRTDLLRAGKRLVFAQALLSVEGRTSVRANGVFSVPSVQVGGEGMVTALRRLLGTEEAAAGAHA